MMVFAINALSIAEWGVVVLGEPLIGGEGVVVRIHLDLLLVLFLNPSHITITAHHPTTHHSPAS